MTQNPARSNAVLIISQYLRKDRCHIQQQFIDHADRRAGIGGHRLASLLIFRDGDLSVRHKGRAEGKGLPDARIDKLLRAAFGLVRDVQGAVCVNAKKIRVGRLIPIDDAVPDRVPSDIVRLWIGFSFSSPHLQYGPGT